jgi:hypothetical protein
MSEKSTGREQLVAILSDAVAGGADTVTLEYDSGRCLEVLFHIGNAGAGFALRGEEAAELRAAVYDEKKKGRGRMRLNLHGKDYIVQIKPFDSFGETAYRLVVREAKR